MPAGYVTEDGIDYLVRVGDKFRSVKDMKNLVILDMEGIEPIKLSDVASVKVVNNADRTYAKINGKPGVMLSIQKQTGYSTGDVSNRVQERLEQTQKDQQGIDVAILMDQGIYIDMIVSSVLDNLIYGAILSILILLVFLRSIRPTFVIACSIPISIMAAIVAMYFSGVTLNIISLSGLALGVGMLVDNSIVVIENIFRMRNEEGVGAERSGDSRGSSGEWSDFCFDTYDSLRISADCIYQRSDETAFCRYGTYYCILTSSQPFCSAYGSSNDVGRRAEKITAKRDEVLWVRERGVRENAWGAVKSESSCAFCRTGAFCWQYPACGKKRNGIYAVDGKYTGKYYTGNRRGNQPFGYSRAGG